MKKSRKGLQATQSHMKIVPSLISDVDGIANDLGSTPMLYHLVDNITQHSRVMKIKGSPLSEKRIESSKPARFKAMKGLVRKENNFNGVNIEQNAHLSRKGRLKC